MHELNVASTNQPQDQARANLSSWDYSPGGRGSVWTGSGLGDVAPVCHTTHRHSVGWVIAEMFAAVCMLAPTCVVVYGATGHIGMPLLRLFTLPRLKAACSSTTLRQRHRLRPSASHFYVARVSAPHTPLFGGIVEQQNIATCCNIRWSCSTCSGGACTQVEMLFCAPAMGVEFTTTCTHAIEWAQAYVTEPPMQAAYAESCLSDS
jgi:hypothetical protein